MYRELTFLKQIGEGSFGRVYMARWRETTVAVKVLPTPLSCAMPWWSYFFQVLWILTAYTCHRGPFRPVNPVVCSV